MNRCNLLMLTASLAFVAGVASAATNTLVNGATNWNLPASWSEQSVPSANGHGRVSPYVFVCFVYFVVNMALRLTALRLCG